MDRWEYLTRFFEAKVTNENREFVRTRFNMKKPPAYTPEAMIPELNTLGEQGWELIHMEPVAGVGGKGDVRFEGASGAWSRSYFCVFKRRKPV